MGLTRPQYCPLCPIDEECPYSFIFEELGAPKRQPPTYHDFHRQEWGSYTVVPIDQYRQLRGDRNLPADEKVLLFREPSALFFRPPVKQAPALSISAVQTVFSVAPSSVGPADEDDKYIAVPKKAIRAAKQQLRAAREALNALDPFVRSAEIKIKNHLDGFTTPPHNSLKSASEPPSPMTTAEHACRKCGDSSFRSRNALFDHVYSNTCKPSLETPRKSSKPRSSIITSNDTLVNQTAAPKAPAPHTPSAPASPGLFTPVKTRPASVPNRGNESPIEWEFDHSPPNDSTPPSTAVTPLSPRSSSSRSRSVTSVVKHKESSQLSTPDGSHGNKHKESSQLSPPGSYRQPSTPCNCRACNKKLCFTKPPFQSSSRPQSLPPSD